MVLSRSYTSIDLFAGCGGLTTGLESSGFKTILFSELDKDARATFIKNRSHKLCGEKFENINALHIGDVKELAGENLDLVKSTLKNYFPNMEFNKCNHLTPDLLCGGPPCQGYSGIGHRRSHKVEKRELPSNKLFLDMISQIRNFSPKLFLFENVKGILSAKWTENGAKGEIFSDVLMEFKNIKIMK
jgi:Site-specific DNA methylase